MPDLLVIEDHPDFGSASRRAKELAVRFTENTGIERNSTGWAVLASSAVLSAHVPPETEHAAELEHYSSPCDNDLIEEFESDQDDWARSEEDGWFYED